MRSQSDKCDASARRPTGSTEGDEIVQGTRKLVRVLNPLVAGSSPARPTTDTRSRTLATQRLRAVLVEPAPARFFGCKAFGHAYLA